MEKSLIKEFLHELSKEVKKMNFNMNLDIMSRFK
jgi:hypothetical protein